MFGRNKVVKCRFMASIGIDGYIDFVKNPKRRVLQVLPLDHVKTDWSCSLNRWVPAVY